MNVIKSRTSVRQYAQKPVEREKLDEILQSAILAPSAKNIQPWRFVVVQRDKRLIESVSGLMQRSTFVKNADCLICVFLDKDNGFDYVKDCQTMGACIENMLLTAAALGVGSCWIGEILDRQDEVKALLQIDRARYDLMAIISLGYPMRESANKTARKPLSECVLAYK